VYLTIVLARRLVPEPLAVLAGIVVGLASPLLFYSVEFWEHAPAVLLSTLAAFWLVKGALESSRRYLLVAGVTAGLGVWLRTELYCLLPALAVMYYLLPSASTQRLRSMLLLLAGWLIALVPLWTFQQIAFGSFIGPHLLANLGTGSLTWQERLFLWQDLLLPANAAIVAVYGTILVASALTLHRLSLIRRQQGWLLLLGLTTLLLGGLSAQRLRAGVALHDLLRAFPAGLLLMALTLQGSGSRTQAEKRTGQVAGALIALVLTYIACVAVTAPLRGGSQWGPRFLLPAFPIWAVVSVWALWRGWQVLSGRRARGALLAIAILLLLTSVGTQLFGLRSLWQAKRSSANAAALIQATGQQVVVTPIWWFPQTMGSIFYEHQFFLADEPEELAALLDRLQASSQREFLYVDTIGQANESLVTDLAISPIMFHEGYVLKQAGLAFRVYKLPTP